jgi:alanine racemase
MSSASDSYAPAELIIDLDALSSNYRRMQKELRDTECAAVVKADAYGIGAKIIAPVLYKAGAKSFFFANLNEALEVRTEMKEGDFYVFNGLSDAGPDVFIEHGMFPVLNSLSQLQTWHAAANNKGQSLHAMVNLDTGMSRLGLCEKETSQLIHDSSMLDAIDKPVLMTHLCSADDYQSKANPRQLLEFRQTAAKLPSARLSLANSSSTFLGKNYHFDLARPGAALYGLNPTPHTTNPMSPVVEARIKVLQIREIPVGRSVGYGCSYISEKPTRIATIALGYADGYQRVRANPSSIVINGQSAPVIGRVSMDAITVDISAFNEQEVHEGSMVSFIDATHDVDCVAKEAGTIGYEVLTSLGQRYRREYKGGN